MVKFCVPTCPIYICRPGHNCTCNKNYTSPFQSMLNDIFQPFIAIVQSTINFFQTYNACPFKKHPIIYRITKIRERKKSQIVNLFQFARKRSQMVIVLREFKAFWYNLYSDQYLRAEFITTCHTHFSNEGCHCKNLTKQYAPMQ